MSNVPWKDIEVVDSFLRQVDEALIASSERLANSTAEGFDPVGQLNAARAAGIELASALANFAAAEGNEAS